MKLLGISRCTVCSPGREGADSALFRGVADRLAAMGHRVDTVAEGDFAGWAGSYDGVFQMARKASAIAMLSTLEIPVVNTPQSVMNCYRTTQDQLFHESGVQVPRSRVCKTLAGPGDWNLWPCWLKKGGSHSEIQSDVMMVHSPAECAVQMAQMAARGIEECLVQEHVPGALVKIYGVTGNWVLDCCAVGGEPDKFGRSVPGQAGIDVTQLKKNDALREVVGKAALAVGTDVFGADVIVSPDGTFSIIDFNDWPSFGSCRDRAVCAIADLLVKKFG